jgi:hypothetical protein
VCPNKACQLKNDTLVQVLNEIEIFIESAAEEEALCACG